MGYGKELLMRLQFSDHKISFKLFSNAAFASDGVVVEISDNKLKEIQASHLQLLKLIEENVPVYGVTTGFGDSSRRMVAAKFVEPLQKNLISYLLCGTGPHLSKEVSRAVMLCRLRSLSRALSGVSLDLIKRMQLYLERDWIPAIPQEGSLGASGDLIPLAYIAQALQGEGHLYSANGPLIPTSMVLKEAGLEPYVLKAKEGLALVNGTSVMAGLSLVNISTCRGILDLSILASSWACIAQNGRTDAFSDLINSRAKEFSGQRVVAQTIRELLQAEEYQHGAHREGDLIQSRYSLRCAPQILGPILETIELSENWVEDEINGVSDNPVIGASGEWAMGGNFYGGYMSHSMDYLKICLAHIADMLDRQFATLIDEKANSGLPPNLVDWANISVEERNLHHGLKGLHQSMSALTSEVMNRSIPSGIFSRSSESHNQDKVSLGLSAGVRCQEMLETLFTLNALYLAGLAQALDLRGFQLKGPHSQRLYQIVRKNIPRVSKDQSLEMGIRGLIEDLKNLVREQRVLG